MTANELVVEVKALQERSAVMQRELSDLNKDFAKTLIRIAEFASGREVDFDVDASYLDDWLRTEVLSELREIKDRLGSWRAQA